MITPQEIDELERLLKRHEEWPQAEGRRYILEGQLLEHADALIAAARENDLLRTRLASVLLFGSEKMNQTQCGEIQKWCEEYPTQLARENVSLKTALEHAAMDLVEEEEMVEIHALRIGQLNDENAELRKRVSELEKELESHAFELSPAMVQARNDQLNQTIKNLTGFEATDITPELMEVVRKYLDKQELAAHKERTIT